jgi:hypothetical protein
LRKRHRLSGRLTQVYRMGFAEVQRVGSAKRYSSPMWRSQIGPIGCGFRGANRSKVRTEREDGFWIRGVRRRWFSEDGTRCESIARLGYRAAGRFPCDAAVGLRGPGARPILHLRVGREGPARKARRLARCRYTSFGASPVSGHSSI